MHVIHIFRSEKTHILGKVFSLTAILVVINAAGGSPITYATSPSKPYFVVQGGDVGSGSSFEGDGGSGGCNLQSTMYLGAFNNDNDTGTTGSAGTGSAGPGWYGSSVEGGVYTVDTSQEIVSDQDSDVNLSTPGAYTYQAPGTTATAPHELNFANTDQNIPLDYGPYHDQVDDQQFYGGDFGNLPCMPDAYGADMSNNPTPLVGNPSLSGNIVDLSTLAGGTYSYTGTLIINTPTPITTVVTGGKPVTLAVFGNVYIDNDIFYSYNNLGSIPQFNLNVEGTTNYPSANGTGNIFINNLVTEIHGFLTAQTTADAAGWIHTCATIAQPGNVITDSADYNTCDTQLTIYGALEADFFFLERGYGDIYNMQQPGTNASNAAEVFRYSPELWIPDANAGCGGSYAQCLSTTYAAETSLPPVL